MTISIYDGKKQAFRLQLFVIEPACTNQFDPPDFHPDEVIRMIDDSHLIGFGIADAKARAMLVPASGLMFQAFASWFDYKREHRDKAGRLPYRLDIDGVESDIPAVGLMKASPIKMATSSKISTASKVVVATTVALSFISYWRGAAIVLSDLASSMFYAGGIAERSDWKVCSLVCPRRDAFQLRRALCVHGKLWHVRARRRLRRGTRQHGPISGAIFRLRAGFRLCLDWPYQRCKRRTISGPPYLNELAGICTSKFPV
jgi:hypothetical protein